HVPAVLAQLAPQMGVHVAPHLVEGAVDGELLGAGVDLHAPARGDGLEHGPVHPGHRLLRLGEDRENAAGADQVVVHHLLEGGTRTGSDPCRAAFRPLARGMGFTWRLGLFARHRDQLLTWWLGASHGIEPAPRRDRTGVTLECCDEAGQGGPCRPAVGVWSIIRGRKLPCQGRRTRWFDGRSRQWYNIGGMFWVFTGDGGSV